MTTLNRREFSKSMALGALAIAAHPQRILGANDRVNLGFIGVGNRGDQVLDAFLAQKDMQVLAVCDLNQAYMDFAARKAAAASGSEARPKMIKDYRRLLEMKELDAIVISTPDHWHALQCIEACLAGKDVYVEKPLSLRVEEGRRMAEVAKRTQRVVQVGIHRRSSPFCAEAAEFIRNGGIGRITVVRAFHVQNEWPHGIGNAPDEEPPADFDWEGWLGPAPKVKYNKNRTYYRFRWFYDYSGGQVTNFGVHYIDMIHWALGQDAPKSVTALGGKFVVEDNREIPDTLEVIWEYPGPTLVTFSQFNATGAPWGMPNSLIEFRGTKGTLFLQENSYEVRPDMITPNEFPARTPVDRAYERGYWKGAKTMIEPRTVKGSSNTSFHARNFLDAVKSRQACSCDIETGHRSTSATLLANIALKRRKVLDWDARRERFTNEPEANQDLKALYRSPYKLPG